MTLTDVEKNDLPDSAFGYIEPGGAKDAVGKTAPRVLRHLPYKTAAGDVDLGLLAVALNAVPNTSLPRATQARLRAKLESVAQRYQKSEGVEKYITHEDGEWQVRAESGRVLGTHDSKAGAARQLAAVEASKRPKAKQGGGTVAWPVMPRPGFRGSKPERLAGEKAPNQKAAGKDGTREEGDEAKAAQAEAEEHGFEEVLTTDAGMRMSHAAGGYLFIEPSGKWHHGDPEGKTVGTGYGAMALGAHLGKQPDHMGALPPAEGQPVAPEGPTAPGQPGAASPKPKPGQLPATDTAVDFDEAYEDFKRQVKAATQEKAGPGSKVQALVFDKKRYPKASEARAWTGDHGFAGTKVEETAGSWRARQADPGQFDRMRTVELTEGVQAVVGFPKRTIKAVQQAFFLTASGRLAYKQADIARAECEPVSETDLGTVFKVSVPFQTEKLGEVKKNLYFAASGDAAAYLPAYEDLRKHEWVHVFKAEEQRYTLTVVYPASKKGEEQGDFHGDVMYESELEKSAWNFMDKGTGRVGLMHRPGTAGAGKVVESYIWRAPEWKMQDTGGNEQSVSPGDWVMGIVWSPEAWAAIKGGTITGVSLQGAASKVAVA